MTGLAQKRPMIENPAGGRAVQEWIGEHPDQKVPPYVRLRVWLRQQRDYDGRDPETGEKLKSASGKHAHLDHKKALAEGGEHRESNFIFRAIGPHRKKSAEETSRKSKADRGAMRKAGIGSAKRPLQGRGFAKTEKRPRESSKKSPPRRDVFTKQIIEEGSRGEQ
jgi:hypothetical protein